MGAICPIQRCTQIKRTIKGHIGPIYHSHGKCGFLTSGIGNWASDFLKRQNNKKVWSPIAKDKWQPYLNGQAPSVKTQKQLFTVNVSWYQASSLPKETLNQRFFEARCEIYYRAVPGRVKIHTIETRWLMIDTPVTVLGSMWDEKNKQNVTCSHAWRDPSKKLFFSLDHKDVNVDGEQSACSHAHTTLWSEAYSQTYCPRTNCQE